MDMNRYIGKTVSIRSGAVLYKADKTVHSFIPDVFNAKVGVAVLDEKGVLLEFDEGIPKTVISIKSDITRKQYEPWEIELILNLHNKGMEIGDIKTELQSRDKIRDVNSIGDLIYRVKHNYKGAYQKYQHLVKKESK